MPEYADFGLLESNGVLFACSSLKDSGHSFAEWSCYRRVLATKDFSIGDVETNGPAHGPTFDLGYPILDAQGKIFRILYASVKLSELRKVSANIQLPPETTITLYDRAGVVLARFPDQKSETAKSSATFNALSRHTENAFEISDSNGVGKLVAVSRVNDAKDAALIVAVEVPTATSFADAHYVLWKNIAVLSCIFVVVLAAGYFYSERFFLEPLQALIQSTRNLGADEWRPADKSLRMDKGELGELARAFEQMAQALEERRKQLKLSHEEVQRLNASLEKRVQERTAELAAANRELERFSYSVSHDLRAPLRAMQSFASILKEDFSSEMPPEALDFLERISRAAVRLDGLINDILAYSQVAAVQLPLGPIDLNDLVRDVLQTYPNLNGTQMDVQRLPVVTGQKSYLTQCFSNLISNAMKFVPQDRKPQIKIWSETRNGSVRIWVEDNGVGIAPEHQARIFEMFERLEPHAGVEGTGIGLAIVRAAVERMSGKIGFESEVGKGTRFWIELAPGEMTRN